MGRPLSAQQLNYWMGEIKALYAAKMCSIAESVAFKEENDEAMDVALREIGGSKLLGAFKMARVHRTGLEGAVAELNEELRQLYAPIAEHASDRGTTFPIADGMRSFDLSETWAATVVRQYLNELSLAKLAADPKSFPLHAEYNKLFDEQKEAIRELHLIGSAAELSTMWEKLKKTLAV